VILIRNELLRTRHKSRVSRRPQVGNSYVRRVAISYSLDLFVGFLALHYGWPRGRSSVEALNELLEELSQLSFILTFDFVNDAHQLVLDRLNVVIIIFETLDQLIYVDFLFFILEHICVLLEDMLGLLHWKSRVSALQWLRRSIHLLCFLLKGHLIASSLLELSLCLCFIIRCDR